MELNMLYDIASAPTATNSVILLHPQDNVAVARVALAEGQPFELGGSSVITQQPIPAGHKVAICRVPRGERVLRYGNVIGFATRDIDPGEHVHLQNLG